MTKEELQALLQKRLDVLHVDLQATMHGRADTASEKLAAIHTANVLAGAKMELQLFARFLGVSVMAEEEVALSVVDEALYPSSATYEHHLRQVNGMCGCTPHAKKAAS